MFIVRSLPRADLGGSVRSRVVDLAAHCCAWRRILSKLLFASVRLMKHLDSRLGAVGFFGDVLMRKYFFTSWVAVHVRFRVRRRLCRLQGGYHLTVVIWSVLIWQCLLLVAVPIRDCRKCLADCDRDRRFNCALPLHQERVHGFSPKYLTMELLSFPSAPDPP